MDKEEMKEQFKFYRIKVREVLLNEWDPIGVWSVPEAQDEYDSYALQVCKLMQDSAGQVKIAQYLWDIASNNMGLGGEKDIHENTLNVAAKLVRLAKEYEAEQF